MIAIEIVISPKFCLKPLVDIVKYVEPISFTVSISLYMWPLKYHALVMYLWLLSLYIKSWFLKVMSSLMYILSHFNIPQIYQNILQMLIMSKMKCNRNMEIHLNRTYTFLHLFAFYAFFLTTKKVKIYHCYQITNRTIYGFLNIAFVISHGFVWKFRDDNEGNTKKFMHNLIKLWTKKW